METVYLFWYSFKFLSLNSVINALQEGSIGFLCQTTCTLLYWRKLLDTLRGYYAADMLYSNVIGKVILGAMFLHLYEFCHHIQDSRFIFIWTARTSKNDKGTVNFKNERFEKEARKTLFQDKQWPAGRQVKRIKFSKNSKRSISQSWRVSSNLLSKVFGISDT